MPAEARYLNKKQEVFARFIARGATQAEAYEMAGYEPSSSNAATLANQPKVKQRIEELKAEERQRQNEFLLLEAQAKEAVGSGSREDILEVEKSLEWSVQRVLDMMGENTRLAQVAGEFRAANECLKMMGDALGMFGKKDSGEGNGKGAQNTLALIGRVTQVLADQSGDSDPEEPNALRPRLDRARNAEPE